MHDNLTDVHWFSCPFDKPALIGSIVLVWCMNRESLQQAVFWFTEFGVVCVWKTFEKTQTCTRKGAFKEWFPILFMCGNFTVPRSTVRSTIHQATYITPTVRNPGFANWPRKQLISRGFKGLVSDRNLRDVYINMGLCNSNNNRNIFNLLEISKFPKLFIIFRIQWIQSFKKSHHLENPIHLKKPQVSFYHTAIRKRLPYIGNVSSVDVMRVKMDGNGDSAFGSAGGVFVLRQRGGTTTGGPP